MADSPNHDLSPIADDVQANVPAETGAPLRRPVFKSAPERRKSSALNVYVNQNAEWAARQIIPAGSPRAVFRKSAGRVCPKCGSHDTRISTTRGIADIFMFLFEYSNARCRNCGARFRIWTSAVEEDAHPAAD